jgi:hypothetical protein
MGDEMANTGSTTSTTSTGGTMTDVMRYFGMKATEFRTEWKALDETERDALKAGVGKSTGEGVANGSLTY